MRSSANARGEALLIPMVVCSGGDGEGYAAGGEGGGSGRGGGGQAEGRDIRRQSSEGWVAGASRPRAKVDLICGLNIPALT